eukprot:TRINITY_DN1528_c1_g1_i1.p1 TRINITY_DN1528_c1_g1~~TRINITY_DN1528_c1_g1_i1.p1  ORF type:complete len:269 (-),score=82.36 TRINITY_DN1528_c1_g1_i1:91-897(-)
MKVASKPGRFVSIVSEKGAVKCIAAGLDLHSGSDAVLEAARRTLKLLPDSVCSWLEQNRLSQYETVFLLNNVNTAERVAQLTPQLLDQMQIPHGHAKKILLLARDLEANVPHENADAFSSKIRHAQQLQLGCGPPAAPPARFQIPTEMICPITRELMEDPVIIADGCSYERHAIAQWLQRNQISPLTGRRLANAHVIPNLRLLSLIQEFRQQHRAELQRRKGKGRRRRRPPQQQELPQSAAPAPAVAVEELTEEAALRQALDLSYAAE